MLFYNSSTCEFSLLNFDELRNKFDDDIIFDEYIKKHGYIINVKFRTHSMIKCFYIVDMLRFITDESISRDSDVLLLKKLIRSKKIEKLRNGI